MITSALDAECDEGGRRCDIDGKEVGGQLSGMVSVGAGGWWEKYLR